MTNLAIDSAFASSRHFRRRTFKRVIQRVDARVGDDGDVQRLSLSSGGYLYERDEAMDRQQASVSTEQRSLRVLPNQLVVNPMWLTGGGVAVSQLAGAVSPDYRVFELSSSIEPRFLHHLLRSQPYRDQYNLFVRANTTFDRRIQQADLDQLPLWLPSLEDQQRIAAFLDDRVARIDRIIAARRHQIDGLNGQVDAQWSSLDDDLRTRYPMIPIRRVLRSIVDGPFGSSLTSSHYSDEGTRVIRLGNVGLAEFRDDDKAYVPDEYGTQLAAHSVGPGDLVMAGLGDERWPLGRCTVAPPDLGPAIVKADCYRIRLDGRISHAFAATFLSGPWSRAAFRLLARGSTRARLNTDLARGAELPLSPEAVQQRYCGAVQQTLGDAAASRTTLEHSIHLLTEYKQSLITAAVTGELDVTTTGSRILE